MHMADALVSTAVGATMWCATGGTLSASIRKIRLDFDEKKVPMMGIMGAFVFASQMINFTIPGTGSSGHIGGAMLLAGILGPAPAFLTLAVVLLIQALFFADGGLLAYGCNVFNMGFYACFIAYPLIFKPILKRGITKKRLTIASIAATVIGLQLGAFSVVMETLLSGITELPFEAFLIVMQPIHLAIGIVEGIITAGVLNYVYSIRADIIEDTLGNSREVNEIHKNTHQWKKVILIFAVFSVIIGAVFSQFASSKPDGLEWSIAKTTNQEEIKTDSQVNEKLDKIQKKVAFLPDYTLPNQDNERIGTSLSGVIGGIAVCAFSAVLGVIITKHRKRENSK